MKTDKASEIVYKDKTPAILGGDFINTDAHKFGVLSVVNKESDNLDECIAKSISQIQKLREAYAKNFNGLLE